MRRIVALVVAIAALSIVPVADAAYFINRSTAEHFARSYWKLEVDYRFATADCHPRGRASAQSGYIYHTWSCFFQAGDSRFNPSCAGTMQIKGSTTGYYARVLLHRGACPRGTKG